MKIKKMKVLILKKKKEDKKEDKKEEKKEEKKADISDLDKDEE